MIRFTLTITIVFSIVVSAHSQDYNKLKLAIDHLKIVNEQWIDLESFAPKELVSFNSEEDRIEYHLNCVSRYLKNNGNSNFSPSALTNRTQLIASLDEYAQSKVFPQNIYHPNRQPYFIDHLGTHCAVGQLMANSGCEELAQEIHETYNYNYIEDIDHPDVLVWANQHGFSQEELKLIQPTYYTSNQHGTPGGGCNAPIDIIVENYNDSNNRLYLKGDFTEIGGGVACSQLAYYENENLHCVEPTIEGEIVDMTAGEGKLIVIGALENEGVTYPMATLENDVWVYNSIPGREGMAASTFHYNWQLNQFFIVIQGEEENEREIWINSYYNGWEFLATVDGEVRCSEDFFGVVFGGDFGSFKNEVEGLDWESADLLRVQYADFFDPVFSAVVSNDLPENIYSMYNDGSQLVLAIGTESVQANDILFAYLDDNFVTTTNVTFEILAGNYLTCSSEGSPFYVYDITEFNGTELLISGEFCLMPNWYFSSGLSTLSGGYPDEPIALLDGAVKSCVNLDGDLYYGGDFLTNTYSGDFGYLEDQPVEYFGTDLSNEEVYCEDSQATVIESYCIGDSVLVDGEYYFDTHIGEETIESWLGCDSVVTTFYIFTEPFSEFNENLIACEGQPVLIDGTLQTEPGIYETYETNDGGCVSKLTTNLEVINCSESGCTNPLADNYNQFATEDDGSCTYENMIDVCGTGTVWDGLVQACVVSCPGDLNGDYYVNANDLLEFLGTFGTYCE